MCPTSGRLHYQGFIIFGGKTNRIPATKRIIGGGDDCHLEPRRGTRQEARDYCGKDGKFTEWGVFEGITKEQLFKQPIGYLKEEYPEFYCRYHKGLEKLADVDNSPEWRDVNVTVLWGEPGTFKSRRARFGGDYFVLEEPFKWFDGYVNQKRLILDDFELGCISGKRMNRILDGYKYHAEVKGGHVWANWTEVYITTNENPKHWWDSVTGLRRRIDVITECLEENWGDVTL